jgi:hypothetical protein
MEKEKGLHTFELGKELNRFEGDKFFIAQHEFAMLFHVYNAMDVIVKPNQESLYRTLLHIVEEKENYLTMEGEEKENYDLFLSAVGYVMTCPLYVFSDSEMLFNVATALIDNIQSTYDKYINMPLEAVDAKLDAEFEDMVLSLEKLGESAQSEEKA